MVSPLSQVSRLLRIQYEAGSGRNKRFKVFTVERLGFGVASARRLWVNEAVDAIDLEILEHLQANARLSLSELGRLVHLSQPAASDRVRKLEESGVIIGYSARIDTTKLGFPLLAFVRMRYDYSDSKPLRQLIGQLPEILECHHVTGEDCYIFKVTATSMEDLEALTKRIATLGPTTTSVVYSTLLSHRSVQAKDE